MYIPAYLLYIYLYEGFVALPSQSLFMLVVVTFVPKICHLVSFSFLFFPSGENKRNLCYSNPSSRDLEKHREGTEE